MATHVHATKRGWVYAPFVCEHCKHEDQGAVFMKATGGGQTGLMQDLDDARDQALGSAHGSMEQGGDEFIALAPCPNCGQRDELAIKGFRRRASPWLGWGGVFMAVGVGGAAFLASKGEDLGWYLMAPLMLLGAGLLLVGLIKRLEQPPSGVVFRSVDQRPWSGL